MWKRFKALLFFKQKNFQEQCVRIRGKEYFLREVTNRDIKDLLAIERDVYAGELPWTKSAFLGELHSFYKNLYLLIADEQKAVGFIGCRIKNKDVHVTNVAVLTNYQNKGIGKYLLQEIKNYGIKQRCETMSLEVKISNQAAQKVYRQFGFVSHAIHRNYYDENKEDALEMILYL